MGHFGKTLLKSGFFKGFCNQFSVIICSGCHILSKRQGKQFEILKNHGKDRHIFPVIVLSDIDSIEQNFPLCRIIQTAKKLDKGRFSASIHTYHSQLFADFKLYVHIL